MKGFTEFIARLTSRKFLLTILGLAAVTAFPEQSGAIVALIATFVGAEGVADTVSRYSTERTKQSKVETNPDSFSDMPLDDKDVDRTGFVAGGDAPI